MKNSERTRLWDNLHHKVYDLYDRYLGEELEPDFILETIQEAVEFLRDENKKKITT